MSLQHFFLEDQVIAGEGDREFALRLTDDDLKHARVLRLSPGEHIAVIDADKDYFECEVAAFDAEGMTVRISSRKLSQDDVFSGSVVLFQGLAKGEKMDAVVRQATELGAAGIVALACERSVVRLDSKKAEKRLARWRSIGKSASMQSGRRLLPEISGPFDMKQACALLADFTAVVICWEESDGFCSIGSAIRRACTSRGLDDVRDAKVAVVVGPEGGLTYDEVQMLQAANGCACVVSLGDTILRTETAGVVASALAIYELGGLGNTLPETASTGFPVA